MKQQMQFECEYCGIKSMKAREIAEHETLHAARSVAKVEVEEWNKKDGWPTRLNITLADGTIMTFTFSGSTYHVGPGRLQERG